MCHLMLILQCWMPKDVAGTLYLLEASWLCKSCGGWKMMLRQQLSFATVIQIVRPSYDWCSGLIYWFSRSWDLGDIPSNRGDPACYGGSGSSRTSEPWGGYYPYRYIKTSESLRVIFFQDGDLDLCGNHKLYSTDPHQNPFPSSLFE